MRLIGPDPFDDGHGFKQSLKEWTRSSTVANVCGMSGRGENDRALAGGGAARPGDGTARHQQDKTGGANAHQPGAARPGAESREQRAILATLQRAAALAGRELRAELQ